MPSLPVQIVRFVDEEPQPGIVESQFRDAQGEVHSIIDKVPMFTGAALWSDSEYPQPGFIECCVLERIPGTDGSLVRITIEPYHVELTDEASEFVISEADLLDRFITGPSYAEVETSLVAAVQTYFLSEPNDHISENENLRPVCKWLARWLRDKLSVKDGCGQYRSVDDILPCTADRRSPTELELTGLLIWMDDGAREWKEPLFAKLHLSGDPSMPLDYVVQMGDADRDLGKIPYGTPHDYPYIPVHRWLFTFVAPDARGSKTIPACGADQAGNFRGFRSTCELGKRFDGAPCIIC